MSWRDDASPGAQADIDALLGQSMTRAQTLLAADGAFLPFAVALDNSGQAGFLTADHLDSRTLLEYLPGMLRRRRGMFRARALVADVRIAAEDTDAIQVDLEHVEGTAIRVHLPYTDAGGTFEYGGLSGQGLERSTWA